MHTNACSFEEEEEEEELAKAAICESVRLAKTTEHAELERKDSAVA